MICQEFGLLELKEHYQPMGINLNRYLFHIKSL